MPRYSNSSYNTKEAQLIYEEALQGYCFRFIKGFNKTVIDIIKTGIPTNDRKTDGPPEWKWYFGEGYFNIVKMALDAAGFTTKIVTKADIEDLRSKQAEAQQNNQHMYKPAGVSIPEILNKFIFLVTGTGAIIDVNNGDYNLDPKDWSRTQALKAYRKAAIKLHPDLNNGQDVGMSELNSTWAILEKGYYIK